MSFRSALILALILGAAAPAGAAPGQDAPSAEQARALLDAGEPLAAAKAYARLCEAQPADASAHHMLGYCLHAAGELDAALRAHLAAAEFPEVRAVALYNCACVHAMKGHPEAAFDYLAQSVKAGFDRPDHARQDPDLASLREDARFAELVASMAHGEDEHEAWAEKEKEKEKAYAEKAKAKEKTKEKAAVAAHGDEAATLFEKAQGLLEEGEYLPAAKAFRAVTELEPDNARAHHLLGYSLHAAGRLDEALVAHRKAAEFDATRGVALYNCACVHALKGEKGDAVALLAKSAETGFDVAGHLPEDSDLVSVRGDALLEKVLQQVAEKRAKATHEASYAVEEHGDHATEKKATEKKATEKKATEKKATEKKAAKEKAEAWSFEEPETAAAAAYGGAPTMQEARALLDAGEPRKAAQAYAAIAKAQPDNGNAHHMVGYCLHMAGDLDAAYTAHLEAAEFDSVRPTALYNAACVHALKGQPDAAFEFLSKAVEAGFSSAAQLEGDSDMDSLRTDPRFGALLASLSGGDGDALQARAARAGLSAAAPERAFDFYVGRWTLSTEGEVYGRSRVEPALGGSGVHQVSLTQDGSDVRAESTYVFRPESRTWKQVWIDREGTHVVLEGGPDGDRLVMTMVSMDGQPRVAGRSVFSNLTADGFEYRWQTSEDGGETWSEGTPVHFRRAHGSD